jgi:membrane protein
MQSIITVLRRSAHSFGADKCSTFSAAIAYYTVFALFPMALVGISVLGFFLGDAAARAQVASGIASVMALDEAGRRALEETLQGINRSKGWLGIIGVLISLWSASGLFGALRSALDSVWDVDRPLPMLRGKARDVLLFFGFGGILMASTASTGVLVAARDIGAPWLGPLAGAAEPIFVLVRILAPLTLTFAAFLFLYRVAPHARLRWVDVLPAAVIAALFYEFGKNVLSFYIRNLGNFNVLAGSLGAAILFLVFVYYATQVILFAAEISKHWLLIRAGEAPVTKEQPVQKPAVPLSRRIETMLARLWTVGEPHHDYSLPYAPARIEPVSHAPTDTLEEVEVKEGGAAGPATSEETRAKEKPSPRHAA